MNVLYDVYFIVYKMWCVRVGEDVSLQYQESSDKLYLILILIHLILMLMKITV